MKKGLKAAEEEGAASETQYEAHTQEQAERAATQPPPAAEQLSAANAALCRTSGMSASGSAAGGSARNSAA